MRKDPLPHSTESQINESEQSVAPITTQALKKQQVFDAEQVKLQSVTDELKSAQMFAPQTPIKAIDDVVEETLAAQPQVLDVASIRPKLHQSRRWSWLARLSLMALILLTLVVLGLVGSWAIVGAVSEYRKLKRLKQVADTQDTGARLALSMQMGEADSFIDNIVRHYPDSQGLQRLRHSLKDEHNDAEKVLLFEDLVLTERDELAKKVVRRYAAESAVLLAASPLAALDMAIILWRNQRMLRDVLVTDLGTQLLSVEMTGKLSARLAQGLGGGLLTARLGYQAMALCRPIGFREEQRPKLSKVHQELLIELKQFAGKLLTKDGRDALKSQLEAAELKTSSTAKDK